MLTAVALTCAAEVKQFPGGEQLPHERYIHVVPESDSPILAAHIQTRDGLYVAAAIRKPKGDGPFPALIQFHGAPGGQGMETVKGWVRGDSGAPLWERYLQEGFVIVASDYRGIAGPLTVIEPPPPGIATRYDDGVAVVDYVRGLPYVDGDRLALYGGSYGGDLVLHLAGLTDVRAAGVGAPAAFWFLGIEPPSRKSDVPRERILAAAKPNEKTAGPKVAAIRCPLLIQVGGSDSLSPLSRKVHDLAAEAGKDVRLEIYANSPHGFYFGPLRVPPRRPLLDTTVAALDSAVAFFKAHTR